jgi:hypothetical protein
MLPRPSLGCPAARLLQRLVRRPVSPISKDATLRSVGRYHLHRMREVCLAFVLAACSGAGTADDVARAYVSAYNRGDGGAIYDILARRDRAAWDQWDKGLPAMPGSTRSDSPRRRFDAVIRKQWSSDDPTARILDVRAEAERGVVVLDVGGARIEVALVREDGEWKITYFKDRH